jgi:hypothetical protein
LREASLSQMTVAKEHASPRSNCVLRRPVIGRPQGWRLRATAFGG